MQKKALMFFILLVLGLSLFSQNVSPLPYGINAHLVKNDVLAKIKNAGIKWIRIDIFWYVVEPQKNKFNYTDVDRVINYAHKNGLSVLGVITGTPNWACSNKGPNYPANNVSNWSNFVQKTVSRYKSKVKYWNIWNEPNKKRFFIYDKDVFVNKIYLPAAKAIRKADSSAFIVGPEVTHSQEQDQEWFFWLKYILTTCKDYIDVVSYHMYKKEGPYYMYVALEEGESFIPSVKEIIEETGNGDKPFWLTETGWNTDHFSESVQGDYYLEMLQRRKSKDYPNKIFFYEIVDDPAPGVEPFGILRANLLEKIAYGVYRDFIAGKYPDFEGDDEDLSSKKCYFEQAAANTNLNLSSGFLNHLRDVRDGMMGFSAATQGLVQSYYKLSDEMTRINMSDSRIFRLSNELMGRLDKLLSRGDGHALLTRKLDSITVAKAGQLIRLLKQKKLSPRLRHLVQWGAEQLRRLNNPSIGDILIRYSEERSSRIEN